jgi:hypothetical protein
MLPHDTCDPEKDRPRKPPPPPPPPDEVPPGTPVIVDPPYDDDDNPDNTTNFYPGDSDMETVGDACVEYDVTIVATAEGFPPTEFTVRLFGEIAGAGLSPDGLSAYVLCRGGRDSLDPPAGACLPEITECYVFGSAGSTTPYNGVEITSITPV